METLLECRSVTKRFGEVTALAGVDMKVEAGEIRGLVGHNGAGKSTLLRCALGLVRPDTGQVRLLGRPQAPRAGAALDSVAGLVDGTRWPGPMRVRSVLRMLAAYDGQPRTAVDEAIARVSLQPQQNKRVASLSLGGRQRLGIAAALLRRPKLLLLDEPVNGLDPPGRKDLRRLLRELAAAGAAVVISSHDLAEIAATCDTVTKLDHGNVSWTSPIAEVAHTAARRVDVVTSDAVAAGRILAAVADLEVETAGDSQAVDGGEPALVLRGNADVLDEASQLLGRAGIAIRKWEPQSGLSAAMLPEES